VARQREGS
ncbi:hypothetical protein D039_2769B, partial [Vibrio parahaemolyticus EKP-028]